MINYLVYAKGDIDAIYYYFSEGFGYVKNPAGSTGSDCSSTLGAVLSNLRQVRGASSLIEAITGWKDKIDKKYSPSQKLDDTDKSELSQASWNWILKVNSIAGEYDKEQRTLESTHETIKQFRSEITSSFTEIREFMSKTQTANQTFVESSPTERSLEPTLRGLMNRTNGGELIITGYFDQYLLKDLQNINPKPSIKFISPELTSSKSDRVNLDALRRMVALGAEVRCHPMLHARLVLNPSEIIVGSADIKSDCLGGRRYDACIWSSNPNLVQSGKNFFAKVWNESAPLT